MISVLCRVTVALLACLGLGKLSAKYIPPRTFKKLYLLKLNVRLIYQFIRVTTVAEKLSDCYIRMTVLLEYLNLDVYSVQLLMPMANNACMATFC